MKKYDLTQFMEIIEDKLTSKKQNAIDVLNSKWYHELKPGYQSVCTAYLMGHEKGGLKVLQEWDERDEEDAKIRQMLASVLAGT